jgi:hypothetical protein
VGRVVVCGLWLCVGALNRGLWFVVVCWCAK